MIIESKYHSIQFVHSYQINIQLILNLTSKIRKANYYSELKI